MPKQMRILFIGNRDSIWTKDFIKNVLLMLDAKVSIPYNPLQGCRFDDFYKENCVDLVAPYKLSSFMMKIPKLRVLYRLRKEKKALNAVKNQFDKIIVMYTTPHALKCALIVRSSKTQVYTHFIGSDILRSTDLNTKRMLQLIRKLSPTVICESCQTETAFQEKIGDRILLKSNVIYLGDEPFQYIDKWLAVGQSACKKKFDIPQNKISVCIGYNASTAQQHIKVIEQIEALDVDTKDKLCLIFPIAYGGSEEYLEILDSVLKKTGVEYRLLRQFLSADEVAALRVATDIFINAQITDSISASVMEAYYAGASLISAAWLNYKELLEWDLQFKKFETFGDLSAVLIKCLEERTTNKNRKTVFNKWSWETCKNKWKLLLE